jgi:hypothetical protein
MKHLLTYVLFVIVLSAIALSGNQVFYLLANVFEYGTYIFIGIVALIIVAHAVTTKTQ